MEQRTMTYKEIMGIFGEHMRDIQGCIETTENNPKAKDYVEKLKIEKLGVANMMILFRHRFHQKYKS